MIEIFDLAVKFGDQMILQDINLIIYPEENLLIVGKSGCGKSVLMKTIMGLIQPCSGKIEIDGVDLQNLSRKELYKFRRKLAMLFQGGALLDSLNVYQNIALPLFEHSEKSDTEIFRLVRDNLDLLGLGDISEKMPSDLSGGMKKRVALARALVLEPRYLIFDEPTTGLDPVISNEIIELILGLQKVKKISSLIVTHDFNCINRIQGRMIMLADRKLVFSGTHQEFEKSKIPEIIAFRGH
ncbi:MAG: ATP-binding cassette domain-containing protein [Candidatus Cloacimonetes bacterium]|nr:ATP-binding cassette domain-containing protein [Candidatus Cloacimonadota bacterium]